MKWKSALISIALVTLTIWALSWWNKNSTKLPPPPTAQTTTGTTKEDKETESKTDRTTPTLIMVAIVATIVVGIAIKRQREKAELERQKKIAKETPKEKEARLDQEKKDKEAWQKRKKSLSKWLLATFLILLILFAGWKIGVVGYVRQAMSNNSRPVGTVTTVTRAPAPQMPRSGHAELWVDDQHWEEFEIHHEDVEIHHFNDGPVVIIPPHGAPVRSYPKEVTVWPKDTQRKGVWRVQALNPGPKFRDTWTWD